MKRNEETRRDTNKHEENGGEMIRHGKTSRHIKSNEEKTLKIAFRKDRPSDPLIEMRGRI